MKLLRDLFTSQTKKMRQKTGKTTTAIYWKYIEIDIWQTNIYFFQNFKSETTNMKSICILWSQTFCEERKVLKLHCNNKRKVQIYTHIHTKGLVAPASQNRIRSNFLFLLDLLVFYTINWCHFYFIAINNNNKYK